MPNSDQPFAQEGYELMGAAFEVRNVQGGGLWPFFQITKPKSSTTCESPSDRSAT